MFRKAIYLYLLSFILIDISTGFLLKFLGLGGVFPIHLGHVVRGFLLVGLLVALVNDRTERHQPYSHLGFIFFYYLMALVCVHTLIGQDLTVLTRELYHISKPLFIIILAIYVHRNWYFFKQKTPRIIWFNFIVFSANLIFSFITGIGLETYQDAESLTKGFLGAGNSASILSLVFFTYYLSAGKKNLKSMLIILVSILNVYIVGTKVIFLVPFILTVYLVMKTKWNLAKSLGTAIILIPLVIVFFVKIFPFLIEIYTSRYLPILQSVGVNLRDIQIYDLLTTYRRTSYAIEQFQYQWNDIASLFFGEGIVGQEEFWTQRGQGFKFAAMDYVDFTFQYGLAGTIFLFIFIFKAIKKRRITDYISPLLFPLILMFLYSFFGGYVLQSLTAGTMFGFLIGINLKKVYSLKE